MSLEPLGEFLAWIATWGLAWICIATPLAVWKLVDIAVWIFKELTQ